MLSTPQMLICWFALSCLTFLNWFQVDAFLAATPLSRNLRPSVSSSTLDCICIDCKWVTSCKAYHFVESKHDQPHMTDDPTFFEPCDGSPTIHVNIRKRSPGVTNNDDKNEWDKIFREHSDETKRAMETQQSSIANEQKPLIGNTKYDVSPQIPYEYDVAACEDFVLDKGCWARNMPEEIKKANPHFVPM